VPGGDIVGEKHLEVGAEAFLHAFAARRVDGAAKQLRIDVARIVGHAEESRDLLQQLLRTQRDLLEGSDEDLLRRKMLPPVREVRFVLRAADLVRITKERFPLVVGNLARVAPAVARQVLLGVRARTGHRIAHHHQHLDARVEHGDLADQVAVHRRIARRRLAANDRPVRPSEARERTQLLSHPARERIAETGEVPVELGRLEARISPVFQAAEEEQLFRLGQEDLRMLAEDLVQPGSAGALRTDDEEVRETVEVEPLAGDLDPAQPLADSPGNQWSVLLALSPPTAEWPEKEPVPLIDPAA
jgi:hypothetical protein